MKNAKNWIIAALVVSNALTLAWLASPRPAQAGFGDVMKLVGVIDLERRMHESGSTLLNDAVVLRQRAVALMAELNATNTRLQVTDKDLDKLNKELAELRQYRDVVKSLTGR